MRIKVKRRYRARYVSDRDIEKRDIQGGFFKTYGKRAGRRLARRAAKKGLNIPAYVCRGPKRLP